MFDKMIRNHEQRRAELERKRKEITEAGVKRRHELELQLGKGNERETDELAAVDAEERAAESRLREQLVADAFAQLGPLASAWRAEPGRAVAVKIGDALSKLLERERAELGPNSATPRVMHVLRFAFCDLLVAAHPACVKRFGAEAVFAGNQLGGVRRALGSPNALEQALRALERELERIAGDVRSGDSEPHAKRYAVRRTLDAEALQAHDEELRRARQEAFERDYIPPVPLHQRSLASLRGLE